MEFGSDQLMAVLLAKLYFTSVSECLYLEPSGGRPVCGIARDLLASIIHLFPSATSSKKIAYMFQFTFASNVRSPFGEKALLVSPYSNVGILFLIFIALSDVATDLCARKRDRRIFME